MPPVNVLAILNQKGGVGKTTTVANLGAAVAARGHRVLLIDFDPQSHLTLHFGVEPGAPDVSMYDVMTADADLASAILSVDENVSLAPAIIDMAAAEMELAATVGREQILRDRLAAVDGEYDYVFIDCPPSLGLLTLNALTAARDVVIPLQPHFLALQGLGKLLETVALVKRRINPQLRVSGVILCMYESVTRLAGEVLADLQSFFDAARGDETPWSDTRIFESVIRRNIKLAESPSHGKTIFDYQPHSHGAEDYAALADEFLAHFPPTVAEPVAAVEAPADPAPAATEDTPTDPAPAPTEETPTEPAPAVAAKPEDANVTPTESAEPQEPPAATDGAYEPVRPQLAPVEAAVPDSPEPRVAEVPVPTPQQPAPIEAIQPVPAQPAPVEETAHVPSETPAIQPPAPRPDPMPAAPESTQQQP